MKSKKFLSIVCALIMMFAISIAIVDTKEVSAAETTKYYYGTTLVSAASGSPTITSTLADGVKVTFKKENASASVNYKHTLYTKDFEISFKSSSTNFEELWFKLTDADNSTKWVKVSFKNVDGKINYMIEDNQKNKTEYADSGVSVANLESGVKLSLSNGTFKLDNATLASTQIVTKSFYKDMAKLTYGVAGVDSEGSDAIINITKINQQSLVTSNSKFEGEARVAPVVLSKADDENEQITSAITSNVKAPANADYTFNYYCLDVLGTGWAVSVDDGDKVNGKLSQSIGAVGSDDVVVKIYPTDKDGEQVLVTLNITAVKDETKVEIKDEDAVVEKITSLMADDIADGHIVATTEGNTYDFPRITRDVFAQLFNCKDGDSYDNVKIQVGYKAPGDNGDYTYASSYAVKLNETGIWYFVYKVTDVAGNETVSKSFSLRVFDETAPTISVTDVVEIVAGEKYSIPSATITDNASGVDATYTKWTLYSVDAQGNRTKIENVKYGEEGYDESILKDSALTPANAGEKYVVVYEARDKSGNVAENVEMTIEVVEGTPEYTPNPFNDFVKTTLIVVACLAGLGIIVLIFVKPRERSLK